MYFVAYSQIKTVIAQSEECRFQVRTHGRRFRRKNRHFAKATTALWINKNKTNSWIFQFIKKNLDPCRPH